MYTEEFIVVIICSLVLFPTLIYAFRELRAYRNLNVLIDEKAGRYEEIGFFGCSVICSGVYSIEQLRNLLSVEYGRYEVIIVVDSVRHKSQVEQFIHRYELIRVNSIDSVRGGVCMRALYRSKRRAYRRFVMVDAPFESQYSDFNLAISVTSFDFVLPVVHGTYLHKNAIEALAIKVTEENYRVEALRLSGVAPYHLFRRDSIIAVGGFDENVIYDSVFRNCETLHTPIVYHRTTDTIFSGSMTWIVLLGAALIVVMVLFVEPLVVAIVIATILAILSVAMYHHRVLNVANSISCIVFCYITHIVSFFYRQKFFLS